MKQTPPVGRLLAEFVVIVVGVLTALAADAWWDGRKEAQESVRILRAVEAELRVNRARLERARGSHDGVARAGFGLLNLTGPASSPEAQAQALELLPRFYVGPRTSLASDALEAALGSGAPAVLEDEDTWRALQALPAWYEMLRDREERVAALMADRVYPRIWLHVPSLNLEVAGGFGGQGPLWEEFVGAVPMRSRFEPDMAALLGDLMFENVVVGRTTLLQLAREAAVAGIEVIDRVLQGLQAAGIAGSP